MTYRLRYSEVDSTQKVAIALAKEGAKEGLSVSAKMQTAGIGRNGRSWESPKGGLYVSVVVHPDIMGLHLLSLAAGLEIMTELSNYCDVDLKLKWPNDIVVDDPEHSYKKLCGIITNVINPAGVLPVAVVGVGLNILKVQLSSDASRIATFLQDLTKKEISPETLEDPIVDAVIRAARRVSTAEERADIADDLNTVLWGIGKTVVIDGVKGVLTGVGASGEALLKTASGDEAFWTGDLHPPPK